MVRLRHLNGFKDVTRFQYTFYYYNNDAMLQMCFFVIVNS